MFESVEQDVRKILSDNSFMPCLLLGKYATEFRRQYKGKIFMVSDLNSVRSVVEDYDGISDLEGRLMVLDGIGFLSSTGQNSLLKFIEESKFPIVLLSYYDKVSSIILSRMKFVFKKSPSEVKNLKFMRLKDCYEAIDKKKEDDKDFNYMDELKFYAENCPIANTLKNRAASYEDYNTKKALRIISKL